jgi:hypothetical protein
VHTSSVSSSTNIIDETEYLQFHWRNSVFVAHSHAITRRGPSSLFIFIMSGSVAFTVMPGVLLACTASMAILWATAGQSNSTRLRHSPTGEASSAAVMAKPPIKRRNSAEATFENPAHASGIMKK